MDAEEERRILYEHAKVQVEQAQGTAPRQSSLIEVRSLVNLFWLEC